MDTVQTIALSTDWIASTDDLSQGRSCSSFSPTRSTYLDYAYSDENNGDDTSYSAICFPNSFTEITCGLALSLSSNLAKNRTDTVKVIATRTPVSSTGTTTHTAIATSSTQAFNLAFEDGDSYDISTDLLETDRECVFDRDPTPLSAIPSTTISANASERLMCSYKITINTSGFADDESDSVIVSLTRNSSPAPADNENITVNSNTRGEFDLIFDAYGNDTFQITTDQSGTTKVCEFSSSEDDEVSGSIESETTLNLICS
jgi:hypothetical protein